TIEVIATASGFKHDTEHLVGRAFNLELSETSGTLVTKPQDGIGQIISMPAHNRRLSKTGQAYKLAEGLGVKVPPVHSPIEEAGIFLREEFQKPVATVWGAH